jgi:hypothetical protein
MCMHSNPVWLICLMVYWYRCIVGAWVHKWINVRITLINVEMYTYKSMLKHAFM